MEIGNREKKLLNFTEQNVKGKRNPKYRFETYNKDLSKSKYTNV